MDGSPPGFSVHRTSQARILEWVAMPSSRGSSWSRDQTHISRTAGSPWPSKPPRKPSCHPKQQNSCGGEMEIALGHDYSTDAKWRWLGCDQLFVTPWTIQSMEFSRPEYWSGLPFPPPGDLPNPGIEPRSPALQADSLPAEPPGVVFY